MTVEQCVIEKVDGEFQITSRVQLACTLVETVDDLFSKVQLLESGAGLSNGDVIQVPTSKISP